MTSAFDFESILLETLKSSSDLSSIVDSRIYCLTIPQTAKLPCVSFQRISGNTINTLMGASGLTKILIQIDCWARSLVECKTMAQYIQAIMPANGSWGAHLNTDQDIFDSETKYYRVIMEYSVWFCENAN